MKNLQKNQKLAVVIGMCSICLVAYAILRVLPLYITLDIQAPSSHQPSGGWDTIVNSVISYPSDGERYFIWRVSDRAYIEDYQSVESIYDYFHTWLSENGWTPYPSLTLSPCYDSLPESEFLNPGVNGFSAFIRDSKDPYSFQPVTCLAIWPIPFQDELLGWHVVLQTENPSIWTRLIRSIEQ